MRIIRLRISKKCVQKHKRSEKRKVNAVAHVSLSKKPGVDAVAPVPLKSTGEQSNSTSLLGHLPITSVVNSSSQIEVQVTSNHITSAACPIPSLVNLTTVIQSMIFPESESLADEIAVLIRQRNMSGTAKEPQKDLVVKDCPPVITSKIRTRLTAMINTMMTRINPGYLPIYEGFQIGFAKQDSNTMKQRYFSLFLFLQ